LRPISRITTRRTACAGGGSGTLFFSGGILRCVFCQNSEVSGEVQGQEVDMGRPAAMMMIMMIALQRIGCHKQQLV
jgi:putative pyruvate formate lyase activating enzyme